MAAVDFFIGCDHLDLTCKDDPFVDLFSPVPEVEDHSYAMSNRFTSESFSMSSSNNSESLENPMALLLTPEKVDDLAFVDDLIPIDSHSDSSPLSTTTCSTSSPETTTESTTISVPTQELVNALPDLCSMVDQDTLLEALCLDIPAGANEMAGPDSQTMREKSAESPSANLVSTLCDFISSNPFAGTTTSDQRILPLYAADISETNEPTVIQANSRNNNATEQVDCDVITDEERVLLAREGIVLPLPTSLEEAIVLTEEQDRVLKTIRRKQRNKESAKESRKRKADYIDSLEKRVKIESASNEKLHSRVTELEQENQALFSRLEYMQGFVQKLIGSMKKTQQPTQKSTCVFVMIFALCVVLAPQNGMFSLPSTESIESAVNSVAAFNAGLPATAPIEADTADLNIGNGQALVSQSFVFSYDPLLDRAGDL